MKAHFNRTRAFVAATAAAIAVTVGGAAAPAGAQTAKPAIAVTSIDLANGTVVISNSGSDAVDVNGLVFCNFPVYVPIEGADMVPAGGSVTVDARALGVPFDQTQGELGVYLRSEFSNPEAIVSYVEWGTATNERSSVAVAAGIWDGVPVDGASVLTANVSNPTSAADWAAGAADPAPETTSEPASDLPETGLDAWLLVVLAIGAVFVAAGAATLGVAGRRRQ